MSIDEHVLFFSSSKPKAQMNFFDRLSSVVCLSITSTTGPISTKPGTKHPCVKGIHIYSNERPRPFYKGDKSEILKLY